MITRHSQNGRSNQPRLGIEHLSAQKKDDRDGQNTQNNGNKHIGVVAKTHGKRCPSDQKCVARMSYADINLTNRLVSSHHLKPCN